MINHLKYLIVLFLIPISLIGQEYIKIGSVIPDNLIEKLSWVKKRKLTKNERYRLVDFSFIACGPCIKGIPFLNDIQEIYSGDLEVIMVFTNGDSYQDVNNFFTSRLDSIRFSIAVDEEQELQLKWMQAADKWSYPTYFLLDPNNTIVAVFEGTDESEIDEFINQITKEIEND